MISTKTSKISFDTLSTFNKKLTTRENASKKTKKEKRNKRKDKPSKRSNSKTDRKRDKKGRNKTKKESNAMNKKSLNFKLEEMPSSIEILTGSPLNFVSL